MDDPFDVVEVLRHEHRKLVVASDADNRNQIVRAAHGVHLGDFGPVRELLRDTVDEHALDVHQNDRGHHDRDALRIGPGRGAADRQV